MIASITGEELAARVEHLEGWSLRDGKLFRQLQFDDFAAAWGFMSTVAVLAEKMDHHPEWFNVYGRVGVTLTTHSAEGITSLDVTLAAFMDQASERLGLKRG